jgi:hypothetical protein
MRLIIQTQNFKIWRQGLEEKKESKSLGKLKEMLESIIKRFFPKGNDIVS